MTMQQETSVRRPGRRWNGVSGRRRAIAVMAAALLLALPYTASGQSAGQSNEPGSPGASAPGSAPAPPATGAAPSLPSQPAQAPAASPGGATASGAAPATAALPGEHMISGADLPEDLSPWGMFENSDLVV